MPSAGTHSTSVSKRNPGKAVTGGCVGVSVGGGSVAGGSVGGGCVRGGAVGGTVIGTTVRGTVESGGRTVGGTVGSAFPPSSPPAVRAIAPPTPARTSTAAPAAIHARRRRVPGRLT